MSVQANGKNPPAGLGNVPILLIVGLRSVPGLGPVLRVVGAVLVFVGSGWGFARFLSEHPYILLVVIGLTLLIVSLVACREGLVSYLSPSTQDFLLRCTFFDAWYDDSGFQNGIRKWGRVLLLSLEDGQSVSSVRAIVRDLDPKFVDNMMQAPVVEYLPHIAQRVLLPEDSACLTAMRSGHEAAQDGRSSSSKGPTGTMTPSLTAPAIARMIREKFDAKTRLVTEQELGSVVIKAMALEPMMRSWAKLALRGAQATAAAATVWWGTSALMLRRGAVQKILFRSLGLVGIARASIGSREGDEQVSKATRVAAGMGVLSLGASIAVTVYYRRVASAWDADLRRGLEDSQGECDDESGSEDYVDNSTSAVQLQESERFRVKLSRARKRAIT